MEDLVVTVDIRRPPPEVRAWWTELPDEYVATDPREQPHRIVVTKRDGAVMELATYWRGPLGRELVIREMMTLRDDGGWSVDVGLPLGLAQRDEFTLTPTPEGTRVRIGVGVTARTTWGRLMRPLFLAFYARRQYPRTWRAAARICERDAPRRPPA